MAEFDVIIKGAQVVDGSCLPPYGADIGLRGSEIAAVGALDSAVAARTFDAAGRFVCPGFVDVHAHSDLMALVAPTYEEKVRQGVTVEILGNCGLSVAPVSESSASILQDALLKVLGVDSRSDPAWTWRSMRDYLTAVERARPSLNVGALVGHGTLRAQVMGIVPRPASAGEARQMARLLDVALDQGALGFSSGTYLCAGEASLEEMVILNEVVARHGRPFTYHMPSYDSRLVESGHFAREIGARTGVAVHISHIKTRGHTSRSLMSPFLDVVQEARARGVRMTGDLYPYTAGSSVAWSIFPPSLLEGGVPALLQRLRDPDSRRRLQAIFDGPAVPGWWNLAHEVGWEQSYVAGVRSETNRHLEGKSFAALAEERGTRPLDALMDILLEEDGQVTYTAFDGSEEDIETLLRTPGIVVGSDGVYGGHPHPRLYGTFPRMLAEYVRTRKVLSLEECVYRMSTLPALIFNLTGRGFIRPGMQADLVVLDLTRVRDTATYQSPASFPEGIDAVWVNGCPALEAAPAGQVLRA